ncbi:MAG: LysR family transcriptional regulator [Candidatus Xenobia bacterium]
MELQLRHLRYFVTVAEELHFGRAAERLHIAQPPLSQQIRQLEDYLGVRLFERTRRKVELTDAGRIFLDEARRTLSQAQQAVQSAQQAGRGQVGRLEIGFAPSAPFNILPSILKTYRERFSKVTLVLHEMTTTEQVEGLRHGTIDVGFVRLPVEDDSLATEVALREPLVAALPEAHRLAPRSRIQLKQLAAEPFLMFPRQVGPGLYDQILGLCFQAGFSPKVTQEASQMPTIIGLVGAGFGVALVPASVQNIHGSGVVFRPLQNSSVVELGIATRREEASAVLRSFLQIARDYCREAS